MAWSHLALRTGGLAYETALDQGLSHASLIALHRCRGEHDGEAGCGQLVVNLYTTDREPSADETAVWTYARCILEGQACHCCQQNLFGSVIYQADFHGRNGDSHIQGVAQPILL